MSATPVAIVTGAGSGIGRATTLRLAREGWSVALVGRRPDALNETIRLAGSTNAQLLAYSCDIAKGAAVDQTMAAIVNRCERVDLLVNAAGTNSPRRSLAEFTPGSYDEILATNLHGAVRCTVAVLPTMRKQEQGTIININSEAGRAASARAGAAYVVSKFGLTGFTQTLNLEERAHGIRACSIFPGDVNTPLLERRPEPPPPEVRATFLQPEDVAAAAWFVASLPSHVMVEEILLRQR